MFGGAQSAEERAGFTYRPAIDPFTLPPFGLAGSGAKATARVLTVMALEGCDSTLVVIPRPDATTLFGLAEDELLDGNNTGLFIPGNLDSALAYLETELASRHSTRSKQPKRLLLVADCGTEADRIKQLHDRHHDEFSAILTGDWQGTRATVDEDGLVQTSPALKDALPDRLPAMSRTEARDRLNETLQRDHPRTPLPRKPRKLRRNRR